MNEIFWRAILHIHQRIVMTCSVLNVWNQNRSIIIKFDNVLHDPFVKKNTNCD